MRWSAWVAVFLLAGLCVPPADGAPPVFDLPPVRIGDHIEYEITISGDGAPTRFHQATRVEGFSASGDRGGNTHTTLLLSSLVDPPASFEVGAREMARVAHVSVHNLLLIRHERVGNVTRPMGPAEPARSDFLPNLQTQETVARSEFLPNFPDIPETGPHPWFGLRGPAVLDCAAGSLTVRSERSVEFGRSNDAPAAKLTATTTLTGPVTATIKDASIWTPEYPYPVEIQRDVIRPGENLLRIVSKLRVYVPGDEPVTFPPSSCGLDPGPPERGPAGAPTGITRASAAYPLAEAQRNVEQDMTLEPFATWSRLRSDRRLLGFDFTIETEDISADYVGAIWVLVYAAGTEAMTVTSELADRGTPPINANGGVFEISNTPWVDTGDIPTAPIALGVAEQRWEAVARSPMLELGANRLWWGLSAQSLGTCNMAGNCGNQPAQEEWRVWNLDRVLVSHSAGNQLGTPAGVFDWAWVNVTTGEIEEYTAFQVSSIFVGRYQLEGRAAPQFLQTPSHDTAHLWEGAAAIGAAALGIALLVKLLGTQWAGALYAKIVRNELLDHPSRRAIVALVEMEDGIGPPEIAKRLGLAWSTLMHHLRTLERAKLVRVVRTGARAYVFGLRGQVGTTLSRKATALLRLVEENPGIYQSEAARRLGTTPQALARHLRMLRAAHRIDARQEGRIIRIHPASATK